MRVTSGQAAQRQRGLLRRAHARCFNFNVQAPRMASKPQIVQARPKPVGHSSQNPLQRHRPLPFLAATRRQRHPLRRNRDRDRTIPLTPVCVHADYSAKASDATILQLPLKSPLAPSQIRNVFGFPRSLRKAYSLGGVLGAGSFGVVREATERATGRLYAVKSIPKSPKNGKPTPRYLLKLQTEVDAMGQLGASLDAVYLKDVFEDDVSIHLVMELCRGGSVLDRLKEGEYSERQVAHIMRAVLRFLSQCHAKGLVYRDVKPENFMLLDKEDAAGEQSQRDEKKSKRDQGGAGTAAGGGGAGTGGPAGALWRNFSRAVGLGGGDSDGSSASPSSSALASSSAQASPGMRSAVKATDFGLAIRHSPGELPLKSRSGTPAYMAPEVINQRYDCQADVWSAGVMMWQLLTGRFPFWENVRDCTLQQVWTAILTQDVDFNAPELRQLSPTARDLLRQMLARDPRDRITASEALQHEWLRREDAASALPLRSSVVQRLQRFATYSRLKQLVFRLIADEFRQLPSAQPEARAMVDGLTTLFNELDVDASGTKGCRVICE
jgi:serine/threonine protein kinase